MNLSKTLSIAALLALLVLSFARAPIALAAGIVVTTTADNTTTDGGCALREAITNANNNAATFPDCAAGTPGADFITFNIPANDAGCAHPNSCTISLTATLVHATDTVSIDGAPQKITIDGGNAWGIFGNNTAGVSLSIHNLTMYRGRGGFDGGGGVYNNNGGTVFVDRSTFIENSGLGGGAVHNVDGIATIVNSTIVGSASFSQVASGTLGVGGTLNIYNTTIDGLGTPLRSGVEVQSGSGFLFNTIVANHTTGDCVIGMAATFTTNLFSFNTDGTCTGATTSATLNLGAVQDNGGPTPTIALGLGSSAIDAALNATCIAFPVNAQDQRGILRPQGTFCDAGAFEVEAAQAGPNFVVTQTADTDSGVCGVVYCTLREAIDTANALIGANTITFAIPATEACSMPNVCTITLSNELPTILDTLTIDGSAQLITVDGAGIVRIVTVDSIGTEIHIQDMTLTNGLCDSCDGGAILNQANSFLTLERVRLTGNHAAQGGAIANAGSVSIIDSTLNDNHADGEDGGGVWNDSGFVSVLRTTVSNNTAEDDGGGLNNRGTGATMYVFNSTLSGNSTADLGGGFRNVSGGVAGLFNVTITNNNANGGGGGIAQEDLSLTIINSIVAGNTFNNDINDTTADCFFISGFTSDGYNLFGEDTGCPTIFSDLTVLPANVFTTVLETLDANGGPTLTHALRTNSPAVNTGRPTIDGGCVELNDILLTDDQRGEPRPVGTACDIGAFELGAPTALNVGKLKGKVNHNGVVVLKWRSLNESELSGFRVYRRIASKNDTGKGEWVAVSDFLGAKFPGSALGNPYRFKDKEIKEGKRYRYRVQVVFSDTHTEWTNSVKLKTTEK